MNIGWRASSCDLIVRVDAHAQIAPDYIELARKHLMSGEWHGVGGRKVPVAASPFGRAVAAAMSSRWGVGNSRYHYASGMEEAEHVPFGAYRRSVIEALGGWDETFLANEDFEFDYRLRGAGGRILFDSAMSSTWACSNSVGDLAYQYHRYGKGKAVVARMHPASLHLRHLAPPIAVMVLVVAHRRCIGPAVSGWRRRVSPSTSQRWDRRHWLARLGPCRSASEFAFRLAVFLMHNAWGVGFIRGFVDQLLGRQVTDSFKVRQFSFDAVGNEQDQKHS